MSDNEDNNLVTVLDYHQRSKHHLHRYADGPGTIDWDNQPDPFRRFDGAAQFKLPHDADAVTSTYRQVYSSGSIPTAAFNRRNLGTLFELSFALSAWKQYGDIRWSLRCNPSSGNLHPTEVYAVLPHGLDSLPAGIYHYRSDTHAVELRCRFDTALDQTSTSEEFYLGLATVAWREAWKYGERAFRYCQLDTGHAIACADYAAASLGWQAQLLSSPTNAQITNLLGLNRHMDFQNAERETAELLLQITPATSKHAATEFDTLLSLARDGEWRGQATRLDEKPMYSWPVIDTVTHATEKTGDSDATYPQPAITEHPEPATDINMATLIRQRRSAQDYDGHTAMAAVDFGRLLHALLPYSNHVVWRSRPCPCYIHPVFLVHRVEGLAPGLYIQIRNADKTSALQKQLNAQFDWQVPEHNAAHQDYSKLGFFHLVSANARNAAQRLACHQAIASNSAFSVAMLAEFHKPVSQAAWYYRSLFWEAGMLGQVMYLEAEASGLQGTGIGCFFDDAVHEILGIKDDQWQCLYQFTIGGALNDARLMQLPPYASP